MNHKHTYLNNANPLFVESLFKQYQADPLSIEEKWRIFFEGYELAKDLSLTAEKGGGERYDKESQVTKLIHAYRSRGHLIANVNPTKPPPSMLDDLSLEYYHLSEKDLNTVFNAGGNLRIGSATLGVIVNHLKKTYASTMGIEYVHCVNPEIRQWIYQNIEPTAAEPNYSSERKITFLKHLCRAQMFEDFLHKKYVGQKRFGLEGLDTLIPGLRAMIKMGAQHNAEEFVIGMAHRGRLNVLVNVLKKSFYNLFTEFEGGELSEKIQGNGDVKYHLGQSADLTYNGKKVHLSLAFNPSHLEAVASVVQGIVRGKATKYYKNDIDKVVPVTIHGDAAVSGQGIVYELANMSMIAGYNNGGTIHIVLNNQLGFTANARETRSSLYCTDVAKITDSPVLHVNADDVEKVAYVFELAIQLRQTFHIDIWVELVGYRRRGHNEGDEPRFTSPMLYDVIDKLPTAYEIYLKKLYEQGVVNEDTVNKIVSDYSNALEKDLDLARKKKSNIEITTLTRFWQDIRHATESDFKKSTPTGVKKNIIDELVKRLSYIPEDFNPYPKVVKVIESRRELYEKNSQIDWAMGEQLAFASLLYEGSSVRLTGQDSERGTFSHRHSVLKDTVNEKLYIPLDNCREREARFRVYNSMLSEYAVLGFEYGYSLARPHSLVIWEAQFGDFANGAQIIIDQFVAAGESKWQRHSGLVMLLPHGYEGMGPEHSSARLERFLKLCAAYNLYVVYPTTPANFFHLLRRQLKNTFRKPLIVMSPKSMLRNPAVVSPVSEISNPKDCFKEVIDDGSIQDKEVKGIKRLLLCTGKIYYELVAECKANKKDKEIAIVRLEQLHPVPVDQLNAIKKKYAHVKETFWVQEEPQNMGAWSFVNDSVGSIFGFNQCISRHLSSSPASGSFSVHKNNQERILREAIGMKK